MVSPRIWVGCAAGDDFQQGMALTQQLISDLHVAGADVVSEGAPLSDEQFLPVLQQELASCQWFILVQTPQGMGSRRVQLALQEAYSYLKAGSLRGASLISVSSEGRGDSAPWPEIRLYARLYAYNGDYARLRAKLLLDLNLVQITGMLQGETGDATAGTPPPVQETPGFQPQASGPVLFQEALDFRPQASGSIEQPVPFQKPTEMLSQSSPSLHQPSSFGGLKQIGSMAAQGRRKTGHGDRPVAAPLFILPKPSRRFWVYSAISLCIVALLLTSAVLAKGMVSAFTSSPQATPITLTRSNPGRPTSTRVTPTPSAPGQSAPAQPPSAPPPSPPSPVASQDAGFVFTTTSALPVLDQAGNPEGARCSTQGGSATVPAGYNVVAVDNHAYQIGGQTYLHIAYPDPCLPGLDFSPNAAIANGTGAVGWVTMNALVTTHVVRPQPQTNAGTVWRDCWGPSACANAAYPNATDTLPAKDAELFAWWTGSYWDVHWWHILDKGGKQASVYGRDWGAFTQ
ncbi:MAG TPA: hypothetical protein VH593_23475 [Ktedonobacteraceae bacterium]